MRQPRQGGAPPGPPQGPLALRRVEVVRTYLELDDPDRLRPAQTVPAGARLERRSPCPAETYRRLYRDVGEQWFWHDRLDWSDEQLTEHLAQPAIAVWELMVDDLSAGYFELQRHGDGDVEIVYFGVTPGFIGRGLGRYMLERAVAEAWVMGAGRVWLHTCTLDHPSAVPNYKARGFRPFREETYLVPGRV